MLIWIPQSDSLVMVSTLNHDTLGRCYQIDTEANKTMDALSRSPYGNYFTHR
jgi:hypothetical protein